MEGGCYSKDGLAAAGTPASPTKDSGNGLGCTAFKPGSLTLVSSSLELELESSSTTSGMSGRGDELNIDIYLVRHGETTANAANIKQGHTNYDLTETGLLQADLLGAHFSSMDWDYCYSSDLTRALNTAKIILSKSDVCSNKLLECTPLVREFCSGILENLPLGTKLSDARKLFSEKNGVKISDVVDGIETDPEVCIRSQKFLGNMFAKISSESGPDTRQIINVLLVSHGGFIRFFLSEICKLPFKSKLRNCSISKVRIRKSGNVTEFSIESPDELNFVIPSIEKIKSDSADG